MVAIPAGFEPATHGVEIRYSRRHWKLFCSAIWPSEASQGLCADEAGSLQS
jgi:hypothetical protein